MTPGPTLIMKAPGCKKPVKLSSIGSGNTFGAKFWTDGKREAPMLPDEPWLLKSPSEGVLFWSDECEELGQLEPWDGVENEDWKDLEFADEPSEDDYFTALTSGVANTREKMRYVRMRLWWIGNDAVRQGLADALSQKHMRNLTDFCTALSETEPEQRLMKAEAMRELGRFAESLMLLQWDYPKEFGPAVARIRSLCEGKDTKVAELREQE